MTPILKENRAIFRTLAGAGTLLAAALGASACTQAAEAPAPRPPAIQLKDVTLRHYSSAGVPRIVRAKDVVFNRESAELTAGSITADVPPTQGLGRGGVHLEAEAGKGDVHGLRAEALGKLTVVTGAGDRGETVGSVWDSETGLIRGGAPLQVRGPAYSVGAKAYRFHLEDQKLELDGGVHVISDEKQMKKGEGR